LAEIYLKEIDMNGFVEYPWEEGGSILVEVSIPE
jgi:hypothetical protein